jgi:thiamine transport system substrate-binding protein
MVVPIRPALVASLVATTLVLTATACSTVGDDQPSPTGTGTGAKVTNVVLVTHDSFSLPKKLVAQWEAETGYHLITRSNGDAGELTNKLVLTTNSPTGDVAFGVDNTFASRALDAHVFAPYDGTLPAGADAYRLEGSDSADQLAPIDTGDVCVNVDLSWYAAHHQDPPQTLDDLTDPAYKNQFVAEGATTSSPGFAFLLATIAAKGEGWKDYWTRLMANGTKLVSGWEDAYFVDFTGGGGKSATRPIVVSYDSSPAYTVDKRTGKSTTGALLDSCFRQTEYAGILAGAKNPVGAKAFIDFLLTPEVQKALPTSMYVFPVADGIALPAEWAKFAQQPTTTLDVSPADITSHRDEWLNDWTDVTTG